MEKSIHFDKFDEIVKTDEAARNAASHMQASAVAVQGAEKRYRPFHAHTKRPCHRPPKVTHSAASQHCPKCGRTYPPHDPTKCPAREATGFNCRKAGHWASVCRS